MLEPDPLLAALLVPSSLLSGCFWGLFFFEAFVFPDSESSDAIDDFFLLFFDDLDFFAERFEWETVRV